MLARNPESDENIRDLAEALVNFLENIKIEEISGTVEVTPREGNAPLTVTLRAVNVVDPSGIVIPEDNFVWWIKTAESGQTVIGR